MSKEIKRGDTARTAKTGTEPKKNKEQERKEYTVIIRERRETKEERAEDKQE